MSILASACAICTQFARSARSWPWIHVRGTRVQVVDEEASPPTKRFRCTDCAFATDHALAFAAHKRCKHSTHAEASWWDHQCRADNSEEENLPALARSDEEAKEEDLFRVPVSASDRYPDANQAQGQDAFANSGAPHAAHARDPDANQAQGQDAFASSGALHANQGQGSLDEDALASPDGRNQHASAAKAEDSPGGDDTTTRPFDGASGPFSGGRCGQAKRRSYKV